ncbi:MAG: spermidine synthase [bacterium]|jgi:spermidine synthase|nr:spermidine synthase [bacterium]MDP7074726.1 fused MFS/spermidine synthase [Myxococcota bacterium]HJO22858.1 fused MFS/spermidine synthase [Myxococcota bacterium]
MSRRSGEPVGLAASIFFASGVAALVYQVIWQRILGIFSGLHISSVTIIVTAFMAGLGSGSLVGGKLADRLSRRAALGVFAACELAICVFGLISPWLYYDVVFERLGFLVHHAVALPLLHFVLLLVPTFLMGASLPLLAKGLVLRTERAATVIGLLYGVNTLGAALGALTTAWILIGAVGFVGTIRIAALLNLLAAAGALWMRGGLPVSSGAEPTADARRAPSQTPLGARPSFGLGAWSAIYAFGGFVALSLELFWFRLLDVSIKASPYTFGHLLGIYLGFLALGSLVGSRWVVRWRRPDLVFLWGQWGISASAGAALVFLCVAPPESLWSYWRAQTGIAIQDLMAALGAPGLSESREFLLRFALVYGLLPLLLMAVPTFLMGLTFPCLHRAVQTDLRQIGWRVGLIQASNIVGAILGSLLTGTLLLGVLGSPGTARLLLASGVVFASLCLRRLVGRGPRMLAVAAGLTSLFLVQAVPGPETFWARFHGAPLGSLFVAEDASGVAAMHVIDENFVTMRVNGRMHSMLPYGDEHTILGLLPVLLHENPEEVLIIGLGSGNTAWAVGANPGVRRIDVYEIVEPEVTVLRALLASGVRYAPVERVLADPRVELRFSDGRLALRSDERAYDVVEADALEPSMAYSGSLYSREFFELGRSRLKRGGLMCTYVPTARTRRTVLDVFPYALDFHSPEFASFMIGSNQPLTFDADRVRARLYSDEVQSYLRSSSEQGPTTKLMERFLDQVEVTSIDASGRGDVGGDVNTDLFPRDEYDKSYTGSYQ